MGVVWEWEGSYLLAIPEISLDFAVWEDLTKQKMQGKKKQRGPTEGRKGMFSTWTLFFSSSFESTNGEFFVGARWFGILGVHPSNNPFHQGIPGIQTTKRPKPAINH